MFQYFFSVSNLVCFLGPEDNSIIKQAIYILNFVTCIDFVPYDGSNNTDYIIIWPVKRPAG